MWKLTHTKKPFTYLVSIRKSNFKTDYVHVIAKDILTFLAVLEKDKDVIDVDVYESFDIERVNENE